MAARFGLGLGKGLFVGVLLGLAVHFGLHWSTPGGGALAYLLAIGAAGSTGIFGGRAPWKEGAWIEAALKGLVGAIVGGGLYWALSRYTAAVPLPGTELPMAAIPPIYLGLVAAVFGAFVELDHAGDETTKGGKPPPVPASATRPERKR